MVAIIAVVACLAAATTAWSSDGQWVDLSTTVGSPGARSEASMVYDSKRHRLVLFGGVRWDDERVATVLNDVWSLSLAGSHTWVQLDPSGVSAPERWGHSAIYDPVADRMIVFGGVGPPPHVPLFALDFDSHAWTALAPSGTLPASRSQHTAIYDSDAHRMLVFGGYGDSAVWSLMLEPNLEWDSLAVAGPRPEARQGHVAIHDGSRRRMVISGGQNSGGSHPADTWALRLDPAPTWELLHGKDLELAGLRYNRAVHDRARDRMIVFSGYYQGTHPDDTRSFDLATSTWTHLAPTGGPPSGRERYVASWDPQRERMLIFGGLNGETDTWELGFDQTTPVLGSLVSAHAEPTRATLEWYVPLGGDHVSIQRRTDSEAWKALLELSSGAEHVSYTDTDVRSGVRYGYRLCPSSDGDEACFGEVWLAIPQRYGLAIHAVRQQARGLAVSFELPQAGETSFALVDVAGRRVATHRLGHLASGRHDAALRASGLPTGLYFITLRQHAEAVTRKAAIIR